MSKKRDVIDYRALKKGLDRYHHFNFSAPRKNKSFKPQQKSALTRMYKKIAPYINSDFSLDSKHITFLRYPEHSTLPHIDGIRTSRGLFYKWPQAKLKKSLIEKHKWLVVVNPKVKKGQTLVQKRRDIFYPFPDRVINDIEKIQKYVDLLVEKYKPHDVMWSILDKRERNRYNPEIFDLYFSNYFLEESEEEILDSEEYEEMDFTEKAEVWKRRKMRHKHSEMPEYYNGVFLVYYLNQ